MTAPSQPRLHWMSFIPLVLLGLLGLWLLPVLDFGFVLHDDSREILANPNFHPFNRAALWRIWTHPDFLGIYIPINYTALGALASFSRWWHDLSPLAEPKPGVFHAAGLVLHLFNAYLVFRLLQSSRPTTGLSFPWLPIVGSLVFALHPAQVESYARAGNISITLGGTFSLLSLAGFVACWKGPAMSGRSYARATLFFCLAILTCPSVIMLPAAALVLGWASQCAPFKTLIRWLLPWFIISAAYAVLTWKLQAPASELAGSSLVSRSILSADSLFWYLAHTLLPLKLSLDHGRTSELVLGNQFGWLSAIGMITFLLFLFFSRKDHRWITAGCLIFITLLIPGSGLIPSSYREGMSIVQDRHLYLPLVGAAIVLVSLLSKLRQGWQLVIGVPLIGCLALVSRHYQNVWANSTSLFQHVVNVNPRSWYGHGQLGTSLLFSGRPADALVPLNRALELNPKLTDAGINLGQALLDLGRNSEAEKVFLKVIEQDKFQANAYNNLAVALLRREAYVEAEKAVRESLRLNPANLLAGVNLTLAMAGQSRYDEAANLGRQIVAQNPNFALGWRALAEILLQSGEKDEGMAALAKACRVDPSRLDWQELLKTKLPRPE